jgi:hypothetical protein
MKPPNETIDNIDRTAAIAVVVTPQELPSEKLDSFEEFKKRLDESMEWTFKLDDTQVGKLFKLSDGKMFRVKIREMNIVKTATHPHVKLFLDGKLSRKAGRLRNDGGISRIEVLK